MIRNLQTPDSTVWSACTTNINTFAGVERIFLAAPGFYFEDITDKTEWTGIYELDGVRRVNDLSEVAVYVKGVNGNYVQTAPGKIIHEYEFVYSDTFHKVLKTLEGNYEVFLNDRNGNVYGVTDDETTIRGMRTKGIYVHMRNLANQPVVSVLRVEYLEGFNSVTNVEFITDNLIT